jgi:hypothetical protein
LGGGGKSHHDANSFTTDWNSRINNELEGIWWEWPVASSRHSLPVLPGGTADAVAEIRIQRLLNTSLQGYRFAGLLVIYTYIFI